ncbi:MAG TPA: LysM peptidoglycan-binding domain-containing protein, partial [Opitutus sp.]|nr:LysM peptidoglycan-binding domain-containing protein [Opitutus sp.]
DLAQKLADTEDRLSTALRSFSLLQAENERLKADTTRALETVQATAAKSSSDSAAQMAALFDELRQTKAQLTSLVAENSQLRTRLAIAGPPPGSLLASPSRPGAAVAPATVPVDVPSSPAPAAARTHVVALGDTLGKISRQYYGTPARWEEILRANRDLVANENALPVGITLRIP